MATQVVGQHRTPLGTVLAVGSEAGLARLSFLDNAEPTPSEVDPNGVLERTFDAIDRYFADGMLSTNDLPRLAPAGTRFQELVWEALRGIPSGSTASYAELASTLGLSAGYARAVGTACASNPIAILIPCHRVVPAGGGLGGYRWGQGRKRALLDLEAPALFPAREPACSGDRA